MPGSLSTGVARPVQYVRVEYACYCTHVIVALECIGTFLKLLHLINKATLWHIRTVEVKKKVSVLLSSTG